MRDTLSRCSMSGIAALSVSGGLSSEEQAALDHHLAGGCEECEIEMRQAAEFVAELGASMEAAPPPSLRGKLLKQAGRGPQLPGVVFEEQGLRIAHPAELEWRTLAPGIEYKTLHMDTSRQCSTLLVRMAAGAAFPPHRHAEVEELLVLSGDLDTGGVMMHAGDYCRAEAGSIHPLTTSRTGCTALLISSLRNEILV